MKGTAVFRGWCAFLLTAIGMICVGMAFSRTADVRSLWVLRRVFAAVLGLGLLAGACVLVARREPCEADAERPEPPRGFKAAAVASVTDGFVVFSVGSLLLNLFLILFRGYDLDPPSDVLHIIPVGIANEVWEGLISRSGGSLPLFAASVVVFDGMVGALIGLVMSPLRLLPLLRIIPVGLQALLFWGYEHALASWMPFRC